MAKVTEDTVAITVSMNALGAMKKLEVNSALLGWLESSGVPVKLTAKAFIFSLPDTDIDDLQVPVTLDQLQKLNAGKLDAKSGALLRVTIGNAIEQMQKHCAEIKWGGADPSPPKPTTLNALPPLNLAEPTSSAQAKAKEVWPKFDTKKLKTAEQVKLREATMMYQPVFGTSAGSRYFMVAANQDVRVAARYSGGSLSIRIEGPAWEKHKTAISACGFNTVDTKKGYASVHLSVGDQLMANKTLGAVLLGLGIALETPLPDLKLIKE